MNGFLKGSKQILLEYGFVNYCRAIVWFAWFRTFRRIMPEPSNIVTIDDVKFMNNGQYPAKVGDNLINWNHTWNGYYFPKKGYNQHGEVRAHQSFTHQGNHVCIIGGGHGVTTVHAARQVGGGGLVTVFEGGQIASHVRQVAQLNDVDSVVTVEEAIIGDPTTLYQGMSDDAEVIDPADLPACDVLEMDCE